MTTFNEFEIGQPILRSLDDMGFEEPTPIQAQTIAAALQGRDLIAQAETGTGKTAAFGIPMIERMDTRQEHIAGIVITPTRELAVQVAEELNRIGEHKGIRSLPIYGGQDITRQFRALMKRPQIIVGTPGRLLDHLRRKTITLGQIQVVVLDEADEMLNMGFIEDIEVVLQQIPAARQTLLFSATMPKPIQTLAERFLKEPLFISTRTSEMTVPTTEQEYLEVQESQKFDVLCRLLDMQVPDAAIVFGRTKRRVDELVDALTRRGYSVEGLHGDLTQAKRDSVMRRFKDGVVELLVATDVAARGLDISGVTHVYNFDIPQDPEGYVHRIGRTGRAGKSGLATTLTTPSEIGHLRMIEQIIKRKIRRIPVPTMAEAVQGQQQITVEELLRLIAEEDLTSFQRLAEDLLERTDSVALLSAALKMLTKTPDVTPVKLTPEAPMRAKGFMGRRSGPPRHDNGPWRNNRPGNSGGGNYRDRRPAPRGKREF